VQRKGIGSASFSPPSPGRRVAPELEENLRMPELTERFDRAFSFAAEKHRAKKRKGSEVPYVAHLLAVASLVGEAGGGEEEMMGALLHDVVEDQQVEIDELRQLFGKAVADIVAGCTDGVAGGKRDASDWAARKEDYLVHLRKERRASVLLVSCADKLHNARSIVADLREEGPGVWDRFNAKVDRQLWYYQALVEAFRHTRLVPPRLIAELGLVVAEMLRLSPPAE
jgi:(p)ppGpp synthase/HD superfamily hydrolase